MSEQELLDKVALLELELDIKDIKIRELESIIDWYRMRIYKESFNGDLYLVDKGVLNNGKDGSTPSASDKR